jgi:hypothetical protein
LVASRLKDVTLTKTLTLVDATLIRALPRVMAASVLKTQTGGGLVKWRPHSRFEVDRYVPTRIDVTRGGGGGDNDERSTFERTIQADKLYVLDRGYAKFSLFNAVHAAGSGYVCRVRDNSVYEVLEEKPLTDADRRGSRGDRALGSDRVAGAKLEEERSARSPDPVGDRDDQAPCLGREISRRRAPTEGWSRSGHAD